VSGNDPEDTAAVFAEHLLGGAFTGRFALVLFAVLDPTPGRRTQKAFARTFG
jgi:hypothetical protein